MQRKAWHYTLRLWGSQSWLPLAFSRRYGNAYLAVTLLCIGSCLFGSDLRLLDAVKRRDHTAVAGLIGSHADVNAAQPDGATPLAWAVHLGERQTAEELLAAGAKVNTPDEYGETPLTLACANGDAALVEKLLKAGADAKAARWDGETTLMIGASAGSADVVKLLIAHGAEVNAAESRKGQTALMWAAAEGHSDVVQVLLDHGADVKAASKSGFTALVFAASKNDAKSVKSLLAKGADPNYALPDGIKALSVAASFKSTAAAAVLVDGGADPNVADKGGNTPLHIAAQSGDLDFLKKLVAKGASLNARTAKAPPFRGGAGGGGFFRPIGEQTPLMMAARANQLAAMRALIAAGADPKLKAQDGSTLLMAAAGSGHVDIVKYAYEFDQDVKAVSDAHATVMHSAVTGTTLNATQPEICEVVQFLADKGAPLDEKDVRGRTPIAVADIQPIDRAVELLTQLIVKSGATPKIPSKR
jgi:ankyrin repeat protein